VCSDTVVSASFIGAVSVRHDWPRFRAGGWERAGASSCDLEGMATDLVSFVSRRVLRTGRVPTLKRR
jgi:hypothetical protein